MFERFPYDDNTFDIVVCDFPWKFASNSVEKPGRNAQRHYDCMKPEDCAKTFGEEIKRVMKPDALGFFWATAPLLPRCIQTMEECGFPYKSYAEWDKMGRGSGYWFRNEHEPCLLGRRGKFPRPEPKAPFNWSIIREYKTSHSSKPQRLQDEIDRIWPKETKIELFARRPLDGWTVWGNQSTGEQKT